MKYYAVVRYDYATPSEQMSDDFGRKEFIRYKKRADKAEIVNENYSPFPSLIQSEVRRSALFYFKTKETLESFKAYLDGLEEKSGEFFSRSYTHNVEVPND